MAKKSVRSNALSTRARSTRADAAQVLSATTTTSPTATAARCISLASKICDHVAELAGAINGYLALERFVSPTYADETQASVAPSRGELASMLRALNAQVLRYIDALEVATTVLQAEMSHGGDVQAR